MPSTEPLVLVRGVLLDGDPRLHDLQEAETVTGQSTKVSTRCGIKTTAAGTRLFNWTEEGKAPPVCTDCRDLPPFWAD